MATSIYDLSEWKCSGLIDTIDTFFDSSAVIRPDKME